MLNNDNFEALINSDDSIYHYTTMQKGLECILYNGILKLSIIRRTDDPQEYNTWMIRLVGWSIPDTVVNSDYPYTKTAVNNIIKNKSFIICFCTNEDVKIKDEYDEVAERKQLGYFKSKMWSQYGDHHKGICLVFSKKSLLKEVLAKYPNAKYSMVDYSYFDGLDPAAITLDSSRLTSNYSEAALKHIESNLNKIFFTKNFDYKDESEFRIVVVDPIDTNEFKEISIKKCLKGIILGDNLPDSYLAAFKMYKRKYSIKKLKWDNGRYLPLKV